MLVRKLEHFLECREVSLSLGPSGFKTRECSGVAIRILQSSRSFDKNELIADAGWTDFLNDVREFRDRKNKKVEEFTSLLKGPKGFRWSRRKTHLYLKDFYWLLAFVKKDDDANRTPKSSEKVDEIKLEYDEFRRKYNPLVREWQKLQRQIREVLEEDISDFFEEAKIRNHVSGQLGVSPIAGLDIIQRSDKEGVILLCLALDSMLKCTWFRAQTHSNPPTFEYSSALKQSFLNLIVTVDSRSLEPSE